MEEADNDTVWQAVWAKLDLLLGEQHKTNVLLERMEGKQNLLGQVLAHQAEKHNDLKEIVEENNKRIRILEHWRSWAAGIAAAGGALGSFLLDMMRGTNG